MKQSHLFTKTRREAPKDEVAKNAQLLIRAGYINKEMAGVYSFLPLGLRVMNKIVQVIREEMNAMGGQEVHLTALQDKKVWETTNRWDDAVVDNWFKTTLKNGSEVGLGFTHEEPLTNLMKDHIRSFRDLPKAIYQFQTKFRNEERAKSGIMRAREFLMKDLYSFNVDEKAHGEFYEQAKWAYVKIFNRLGIGDKTYMTYASGGSFSKYSMEFQTITEAGEDTIFIPKNYKHEHLVALNKEIFTDSGLNDVKLVDPDLSGLKSDFTETKAVEVGNIFTLGTKFSDALGLNYKDAEGKLKPVVMGSYGIGPGRVMGTIAELWLDDKGLVWPESVAPFAIHLISLEDESGAVKKAADELYEKLTKKGVEVLYDDRDETAGTKFSDSDLIGIPKRIVISAKTLKENSVETKDRRTGEVEVVPRANL